MKKSPITARVAWIVTGIALGALAAWLFLDRTPRAQPPAPVAIQDGKTIDFSSGKPVVKDSAKEKAIIDAAVKEMEEASKTVTFAPTAPKK